MKQEPGKRIVSKRRYIANLGLKGATLFLSASLLVLSLVCVPLVVILLWAITSLFRSDAPIAFVGLFIITLLIWGLVYIYRVGKRELKEAIQRNVGIPLTRANTAHLPAADSLVRASHEPLQAQQTVLLRAAMETKEKQEELLRASGGE